MDIMYSVANMPMSMEGINDASMYWVSTEQFLMIKRLRSMNIIVLILV